MQQTTIPYRGAAGQLAEPRDLQATLAGGVLTLALDRPAHRNAIDGSLAGVLREVLEAAAADPQVRVVVLRGEGDGFCCGLTDGEEAQATLQQCCTQLIPQLPQPVIAIVHGFCAGGAIALLEACDIAYAAEDAVFTATDRPFDGREAEGCGLVTLAVPPAELQAQADALARELAAKDPLALRFTKETLLHVDSLGWDAVLDFNAAQAAELEALQAGRPSARAALVESFLAGKTKPGLGG